MGARVGARVGSRVGTRVGTRLGARVRARVGFFFLADVAVGALVFGDRKSVV